MRAKGAKNLLNQRKIDFGDGLHLYAYKGGLHSRIALGQPDPPFGLFHILESAHADGTTLTQYGHLLQVEIADEELREIEESHLI